MKRNGDIFTDFCSFSNLLSAYKKAKRGCRKNNETARFGFFFEKELINLSNELSSMNYMPGQFRLFTVNDPKKRTIAVAPFRDRVVHHALVNLLEPIYEPVFIFDSYATRKNKGTHAAILRAQNFLAKNVWFLKMDIEKYFDSIDHQILKILLNKKIKDTQFLEILFRIIDNGGTQGKGLPIGNLTSQFLANVYLNGFDHFIKDQHGIPYYLRYMDDFVIFDNDKEKLKIIQTIITENLSCELNLKLKTKATVINQQLNGLSYLGARIYAGIIRIHPGTLRRSKRKIKLRKSEYERQIRTEEQWVATLNSIVAHLDFFSGTTFRNQVYKQAAV